MDGWIRVQRSIVEHWLWQDEPYSFGQAWIDLLISASWKDHKSYFDGKLEIKKAGTVYTSKRYLADRWKWNRRKLDKFLSALEGDKMVEIESTKKCTTINIVNYTLYQDSCTTVAPQLHHSCTSPAPVLHHSCTTNKKDNKGKKDNINNIYTRTRAREKPTVEKIQAYCDERLNGIDAQQFFDYYEARGWKYGTGKPMVDWKAAVRTWERNRKPNKQDKPVSFMDL